MPPGADILAVISAPQWNFVYHLVILLALEAAFGVAYGHWRRSRLPEARRLLAGIGLLLLIRLLPLVVMGLAEAGLVNLSPIYPPLERAAATISLAVIAWAFLFVPQGRPQLAGGVAGMAILGAQPITSIGTASWEPYVWGSWQIVLCLLALFVIVRTPYPDRRASSLAVAFGLVLAGEVLAFLVPFEPAGVPIWERAAQLFLYPLLFVAVHQISIHWAICESRYAGGTPGVAARLLAFFPPAPAAATTSEESDDGKEAALPAPDAHIAAAQAIVGPLAYALSADQLAIGLLDGEKSDRMSLAAIHNPAAPLEGEPVSFPLDEQLAVQRALRRQEAVQVDGGDDILQLNFMYAVLGGSETGPLLVQPLLFRGRPVGALIAGNGHSKERFGEEAVRLAGALSDLVAQLVIGPRIIGLLEAAMHERDRLAALRQSEWDKRLEALDRDLSQERHSAQLFAQRLVELERGSQQKQSDYDQMARRLMLAEEATRRSQSEAEALARKIDSLARTKMALEDENRGYRRQIAGLEGLLREEPTRLNISVNQPAAAVLHVEDEADVGAEH